MFYDRTARYSHPQWDLESAFKALGRHDFQENGEAVLTRLIERGWATSQTTVRLQGDQLSVTLTDRGRFAAVEMLEAKEPKTAIQKLHSMHWATWGGLAAVIAAIASVIGAILTAKALH